MFVDPIITIYTQVYNTKENDLKQCIESVLNQTYTNFEYFIFDNGCTDGSSEILKEYAAKDARIHLTAIPENVLSFHIFDVIQHMTGEYVTILDSDDWWEPNYLESLLEFAERNQLDIACTGTLFHYEATGATSTRAVSQPLILDQRYYAIAFPQYHVFFRPMWGKLIRFSYVKEEIQKVVQYGSDTLYNFYWLKQSNRMGIDSSILHHYRVHKQSMSYQYNPERFQADVDLYEDAVNFLKPYGPISVQNQQFLYIIFSNAVIDTIQVIQNSNLTPQEKLSEYARIAMHPITQAAYACQVQYCENSKKMLLQFVCQNGLQCKEKQESFHQAMQILLPKCGSAVTNISLPVFLSNTIQPYFLVDDREHVVSKLVALLPQIQQIGKFELGRCLQTLAKGKVFLSDIEDIRFAKSYGKVYMMLWQEKYMDALDEMTGLLLENQVQTVKEIFLDVYVKLAALQNVENAFIFGKIQMAQYYATQKQFQETKEIYQELVEFGLSDLDEVKNIRLQLEKRNLT